MARTKKPLRNNGSLSAGGSFYRRLKNTNNGEYRKAIDPKEISDQKKMYEDLISELKLELKKTLAQELTEKRVDRNRNAQDDDEVDTDNWESEEKEYDDWDEEEDYEVQAYSVRHEDDDYISERNQRMKQRKLSQRPRHEPEIRMRKRTESRNSRSLYAGGRARDVSQLVRQPHSTRSNYVNDKISSDRYHPSDEPILPSRLHPELYIQKSPENMSHASRPPEPVAFKQSGNQGNDVLKELQEKVSFLEKELLAAYQRESSLKTSVDKLEQELSSKQAGFSAQLDSIKKDIVVPATPAPEENKLASLSAQLSEVMKSMSTVITDDGEAVKSSTDTSQTEVKKNEPLNDISKTASENENKAIKKEEKPVTKEETKAKKPGSKKKKFLLMFASLVLVVGGIGAAALFFMGGQAKVDPDLVKNYAPDAKVNEEKKDNQTNNVDSTKESEIAQNGQVQGASTTSPPSKYEESYADVSYGETRWDTHKNPQLGIEFDYPSNSTNVVRTDTSVTVLRKTGYIFKIQYVETALDVDAYWQQIKARNLIYKVKPTTFRELPAIFLELDDKTDYPGNRYLVKRDNGIYDIWYATASPNVGDEDLKRLEVIMNSLKFMT